ncbi:hypothetical protein XF35_37825 [Streptomyces platensis subsp. clarensis]|nr:hypothetical protein [Streptomyces platensis subsp. clarensis]
MRSLLARLRKHRTHRTPTVTYRPPRRARAPLPHHPESPLDGEATRLVRPYLLAHERQDAWRERAFLRAMAVAS